MSGPELSQYDRGKRCGEALTGTCDSIEAHIEEGDDPESVEFCSGIDEVAFCCDGCGWWCEISEATAGPGDEDVCQDCAPSDDD